MFWDKFYDASLLVKGVVCFFAGHIEKTGSRLNYEPDYCGRCHCEWPQEKVTLPTILNTCYGWLIEHSLLFVRFDDWLIEHSEVNRRLPSWWEY